MYVYTYINLSVTHILPPLSLYIYIYIYMEVNYENKSDRMKKIEKQSIAIVMNL